MIESAFVQGAIIGGATGSCAPGTSFARAIQSGYLRAYALLLLIGMFGLALYFLIVSSLRPCSRSTSRSSSSCRSRAA